MGYKKTPKNIDSTSDDSVPDNNFPLFSSVKKVIHENNYVMLMSIIFLGMFLRFYGLGTESLWLDEATSTLMAKQSLSTILFGQKDFAHPPLFYSILHFVVIFDDSEFFVRLPSAIFGTLSILLVYLLGLKFFGSREALISSFLMAISAMHITYSQEARSYSLMVLLVILTIYFFILAYESNQIFKWLFSAFSASVLVYTHFFGFFVIAAIGIFYLLDNFDFTSKRFKSQNMNKSFLISMGTFFLFSFPVIIWLFKELGYTTGHKTWGMSQDGFLYNIFINFSSYSTSLLIIYLLLLLSGMFFCLKDSRKWFSLLSVWLFMPLVAGYFLAGTMPFQPRYLLFIMPAFLLFISKGLVSIADYLTTDSNSHNSKYRKKKGVVSDTSKKVSGKGIKKTPFVILPILFIVLALSYAPLYSYYTIPQKNDWRGTSEYLESVTQPGDYVVALPGYIGKPLMYYYDNSSDGTFYGDVAYSENELSSYVEGKQRVWFLVTWDISAANPDGSAVKWLDKNAYFVRSISNIYIFTYPAP